MENKTWYYYLHTNGDLIGKNPIVVDSDPEYFNSPFVSRFWRIDLTDRRDAWVLILESLSYGVRLDRIKELVDKWKLDEKDLLKFLLTISSADSKNIRLLDGLKIFIEKILNKNLDEYLNFLEKSNEKN
jgi:hypothetical protein